MAYVFVGYVTKEDALSQRFIGVLLVALSATAFGGVAIFGVWAYQDGASTWALLLVRFGVAAVIMCGIVWLRRIPYPPIGRVRVLAVMGLGYVGQAFCYFAALKYAQASLVALLLYLYPALVAVLAAMFLKERLTGVVVLTLAVALVGTALVVGGGSGRPLGIALGIAAAAIYSIYITVGAVSTPGLDPLAVTTVICGSAALMSGLVVLAQSALGYPPSFPRSAVGWGALMAIAVIGSVVAILTFFAGLQRLGATQTAMLSTLEPVVTVGLATWLLAESMSRLQLAGGAVVLGAVAWQALARRPVYDREAVLVLESATTPPA